MRILAIHADSISYKANRKTKIAEEIEAREGSMEDCVILLSSVEKLDEVNPPKVVEAAMKEVLVRLEKLKVKRVMIFPFAHLTSTLSSPAVALQILKGLETSLKETGIEVSRAPFGWYKEYNIKSKGHPMAELSMTICPYEGHRCDFLCPYCENPIRLRDMAEIDDGMSAKADIDHSVETFPQVPQQAFK